MMETESNANGVSQEEQQIGRMPGDYLGIQETPGVLANNVFVICIHHLPPESFKQTAVERI